MTDLNGNEIKVGSLIITGPWANTVDSKGLKYFFGKILEIEDSAIPWPITAELYNTTDLTKKFTGKLKFNELRIITKFGDLDSCLYILNGSEPLNYSS